MMPSASAHRRAITSVPAMPLLVLTLTGRRASPSPVVNVLSHRLKASGLREQAGVPPRASLTFLSRHP